MVVPLTSLESIASQGVLRAQGTANWYAEQPSLECLVNKEHLYLPQRVADILPARARSALEDNRELPVQSLREPAFRTGLLIPTSQKSQSWRPASALPKVYGPEIWNDDNPWSDQNGAIARSGPTARTKAGKQPCEYENPEEKITRYTKKYHHKLYPSRTSKQAPVWFAPVKNSQRHIFEKLSDDQPPEWFVDNSTENPFVARSAARTGGVKNPPMLPGAGKAWSITSLEAPEFMQIRGEPKRKVLPKESARRARPASRGGRAVQGSRQGSRPGTAPVS